MSSTILAIQSWLSSELEHRGIDAVVYARHILDLFLNSGYTTDLHLTEREQTIFGTIPNGLDKSKPKTKYAKRSNSFTYANETMWKKRMAVSCLLAAAEDGPACDKDSIENLIDNLQARLSNFSCSSDHLSTSSDESHSKNKLKKKPRENYNDAFPLLVNCETNLFEISKSVWNGENKLIRSDVNSFIGSKSDPQNESVNNITSKKSQHVPPPAARCTFSEPSVKFRSPNRERRHRFVKKKHSPPSSHHQARKSKRGSMYSSFSSPNKKTEGSKRLSAKFDRYNSRAKPYSTMQQPRVKRDRAPKLYSIEVPSFTEYGYHQPQSFAYPKHDQALFTTEFSSEKIIASQERDICHLYSGDTISIDLTTATPKSKWFRDPESGFLKFEPAYKRSNSGSSVSDVEGGDDALPSFADDASQSENWLWCPSPSLWECESEPVSGGGGGVSRLETIYRPSSRSPLETAADASSKFWESYKAIFSDVTDNGNVENAAHCLADDADEDVCRLDACLPSFLQEEAQAYELLPQSLLAAVDEQVDSANVNSLLESSLPQQPAATHLAASSSYSLFDNPLSDSLCDVLPPTTTHCGCTELNPDPFAEIWNVMMTRESNTQDDLDVLFNIGQFCSCSPAPIPPRSLDVEHPDAKSESPFVSKRHSSLCDDAAASLLLGDVLSEILAPLELQWAFNWDVVSPLVDNRFMTYWRADCWQRADQVTPSDWAEALKETCYWQKMEDDDDDDDHEAQEADSAESRTLSALTHSVVDYVIDMLDAADGYDHSDQVDDDPPASKPNAAAQPQVRTSALAECVTACDVWKTSLRIGNMWQAISGIRPVDVLYSEKQGEASIVLQPTTLTHFRPIQSHDPIDSDAAAYPEQCPTEPKTAAAAVATGSLASHGGGGGGAEATGGVGCDLSERSSSCDGCPGCDATLRCIEIDIGHLLNVDVREPCVHRKLQPQLHDKQTATSFEQQIQLIDRDICKQLSIRPPKANSR